MKSFFKYVDKKVLFALFYLLVLLGGGTTGYVLLEDYSIADGLYMTIITITTVGFGEVKQLSSVGRFFTSILILIGFVSLAFIGREIVETILNKLLSSKAEKRKMKKNISMLKSHYIICGFGRVSAAAVERLSEHNTKFVIIESNPANLQTMQEKNYLYIEGNAVDEDILESSGIKKAAGLLAILPSDPDNLFITLTGREMNPTLYIIARAQNPASENKLVQAGADNVISPYTTAGKKIAANMLSATGISDKSQKQNQITNVVSHWIEVQHGSGMIGQNVGEISRKMEQTIFGLRRQDRDYLNPDDSLNLEVADKLLILDEQDDNAAEQIHKKIPQKVIIVDDNPIILRLYTKLLRRAGFIPLTATNGRDALQIIFNEKPDAAVIDFMLPVISGLEICKKIRADSSYDRMKLILFTSNHESETKKQAMEAGANAVVVKGPEASELIETVIDLLKKKN